MNKEIVYFCKHCGAKYVKWQGKCAQCENWDCLEGEVISGRQEVNLPRALVTTLKDVSTTKLERVSTKLSEVDRVLGDGIVVSSANLLSGDPGVGKSTLILQIATMLAAENKKILYICAEESPEQIYRRFSRFTAINNYMDNLLLSQETNVENIINLANQYKCDLLIVDSIQMVTSANVESGPGTVSQIKECASALISWVKNSKSILFIVGHVTKDGFLAGPKILEHLVDTVLYFEAQTHTTYRILRTTKNRFGPVPESAIFDIRSEGIVEIQNPTSIFISEEGTESIGCARFPFIFGSRPIITEIQALITKSIYPTPIRRCSGININKLQILLAIMDKKLGLYFSNYDVYLNVVGGLDIDEPAVDLPIVVSLFSVLKNKSIPQTYIFFGEIDLLGNLRPVNLAHIRVNEVVRQNCISLFLPKLNLKEIKHSSKINIIGVSHISEIPKIFR